MSKSGESAAVGGLVLVTGAAGPLGSAIATEFAKQGRDLLLHDYVPVEGTETAIKAANANISVSSVIGDILDPAFAGKLFDALGSRRIQVLAHAGGVDSSRKDSQHIFETNFTANRKLVDTFTPRMESGGVIILIASLGGAFIKNILVDFGAKRHAKGSWSPTVWLLSKTNYTAYAVSKRCVQLYVRQKATELSSFGVRIVSVSPGLVETSETNAQSEDSARATFLEHAPLSRLGRADEVASVVAFLASPGATYITGTDIAVDGGLASQRWKATRNTASSLLTSKLDRLQQKNAESTRVSHAEAQAPATKDSQPAGGNTITSGQEKEEDGGEAQPETTGVVAQSPIASTLGSIRSRLAKIQQEGLGSHRTSKPSPTPGKEETTTPAAVKSPAAEPAEIPTGTEADASNDEPARTETTNGAAAEGSTAKSEVAEGATAGTAVTEAQGVEERVVTINGQTAPEGGLKSAFGSLRSRIEKIQHDSATRAKEAHKSAASKGGQTGAGLKSVVGTVRAKLDKMQQESAEQVKNIKTQEGAATADGSADGGQGLKSSIGTLRAKVKNLQEKNAARAKSVSTHGSQTTSTGILQPATEATEEAKPTASAAA